MTGTSGLHTQHTHAHIPITMAGWVCWDCSSSVCLFGVGISLTHHHIPSTPPYPSPLHPSTLLSFISPSLHCPSPPSLHYALHFRGVWMIWPGTRMVSCPCIIGPLVLFSRLLWSLPSLSLTPLPPLPSLIFCIPVQADTLLSQFVLRKQWEGPLLGRSRCTM